MPKRCVDLMVGLQWGSEGKGKFAALLAGDYQAAVRVGGPNAGHTFYHDGTKIVCRSIPCSLVNPECKLLIGPGAVVNLDDLSHEITAIEAADIDIIDRLIIDPRAVVINHRHVSDEQRVLARISSTLHGVGAALADKTMRTSGILVGETANRDRLIFQDDDGTKEIRVQSVAPILHQMIDNGQPIFIEGTQGTLLSLDHGDYPYVTGRNVIAGSLLSDCGVPPHAVRKVIGVMRTYPIRVGGTSGPMGNEISWHEIAKRAGLADSLEERTTVTNKVRRVAELDIDLLRYAAKLNGCTDLMVSFLDYIDGRVRTFGRFPGLVSFLIEWPVFAEKLASYAAATETPISGLSWGPRPEQGLMCQAKEAAFV